MLYRSCSPARVLDGENVLRNAKKYIDVFGRNGIIIIPNDVLSKFKQKISRLGSNYIIFRGECSIEEINRVLGLLKTKRLDYVIGVGGGKCLDTSKAVAYKLNLPIITIPTSAATSAAATALSAIYTSTGKSSHYLLFDKSPDLVVLDYSLLINSPTRFLNAGMADALAKYYETMAFTKNKAKNIYERIAIDMSSTIYEKVFELGLKAQKSLQEKKITDEFKEIIRINILFAGIVGGIGGEGCRACASHAVNNGFTRINAMHKFLHGEVVGFGNLIQLALEKKNVEIKKLQNFYKKLDLPQNFKYFNINIDDKTLNSLVKYMCSKKETMRNMPRKITEKELKDTLRKFM